MSAIYTCCYCRTSNSCNCSNCMKHESIYKRMIVDDTMVDGMFKCAYCNEISSVDESEDLGWRKFKMTDDRPEYFPNENLRVFFDEGLRDGNIISGSKSEHKKIYPSHHIVYDISIYTIENGKIWSGDLNIDIDEDKLKNISKLINKDLYLVHDIDTNFEKDMILDKAFYIIKN